MQQILAYETDLLDYGDIFDGSGEIARKVDDLKRQAREELARIETMGGAVAAVDTGYLKQQLVESNTMRLEAIERGEQVVVGVNKYLESEPSPLAGTADSILTVSDDAERNQIDRLKACGQAPVGREWFPLTFRNPDERWLGVNAAAPVLNSFLDAELKRHNLPPSALALVGFSQGTMIRVPADGLMVPVVGVEPTLLLGTRF